MNAEAVKDMSCVWILFVKNDNVDLQTYDSDTEIILTVRMSKVTFELRLSKGDSLPHLPERIS